MPRLTGPAGRLLALAALLLLPGSLRAADYAPWVVYYRGSEPARSFFDYRLAVFDADRHPPLAPLLDRDIWLLGYISMGEVESWRSDFAAVKQAGIVLDENQYWPGSYFVDIRNPAWQTRILDEIAPRIRAQGFHGFFLDTLDNPPHLERLDPVKYKGMTAAAARLVQALRQRFPGMKIMLNRAFEIHDAVAGDVDFILGEAIRSNWSAEREAYILTPDAEYETYLAKLRAAQRQNPKLTIMTLDYWSPDDPAGIRKIYAAQRAAGFLPYVATRALDRIIREP
ncbi:endo alpha-1,4 polygalactosaminidase [Ferrovibrio sp.]|uniref:endo alpha-1,4 polygalactosaminidase n=1 Tax=Ferrovibrio sp. TaxID=1917215 RepID=UPI003512EB9C